MNNSIINLKGVEGSVNCAKGQIIVLLNRDIQQNLVQLIEEEIYLEHGFEI